MNKKKQNIYLLFTINLIVIISKFKNKCSYGNFAYRGRIPKLRHKKENSGIRINYCLLIYFSRNKFSKQIPQPNRLYLDRTIWTIF